MSRTTHQFSQLFRVKHGYAFKSRYFETEGRYVLLTPGNFKEEGGFRDQGDKQKFYNGDVPEGFILQQGDLLIAMTEQAPGLLGSSILITESNRYLHNQRLGRIVDLNSHLLDKRYLYYLFNTANVRNQISGSASGTKVRHTAPERIGRVQVKLPSIKEQVSVVAILSAYDASIENNGRRVALLEEAALQLYREWFVRLRFPGHEHTPVRKGVPEGWEKRNVVELTNFMNRGIAPRYDEEGEGLVINQKCVRYGRLDISLARHQSREFKPDLQVIPGDVLINSTGEGTLGRVAQVLAPIPNCTVDTHVTIVRPSSEIGVHYLGQALLQLEPVLSKMGRGATNQTELSRNQIGELRIFRPTALLVEQFEGVVAPVLRQVAVLIEQTRRLREARDLLLPRLMSGEVSASAGNVASVAFA